MSQAGNTGDGQCGENKLISLFVGTEGRDGERLFIKRYLNRLDSQEREGFASSQPRKVGLFWRIDHVECWAPSSVPGNKTPEKKIWGFTENHCTSLTQDWSKPSGVFPVVPASFGKVWSQQMYNSCLWNLLQENQRALPPPRAQQHPSPHQNPASDEGCHKEMPKVCSPYTPSLLLFPQQEYESSPEENCQWGMIFLWLLPGWEIMPCFFANCLICRAEHIGLMSNWYIPLQTADPTTEWDANLIIPHVGNRNGISLLNLFSYVGKIKNKKRCWSGLCELNTFHSPELQRNELCSCCRSLTG